MVQLLLRKTIHLIVDSTSYNYHSAFPKVYSFTQLLFTRNMVDNEHILMCNVHYYYLLRTYISLQ